MKIQIDGTNTSNKGAELMLYAILEEIENKKMNCEVFFNPNNTNNSIVVNTALNFKKRIGLNKFFTIPSKIFRKLNFPYRYFTSNYADKNIDVIIDAGGFQFSDQWKYSNAYLNSLESYYKSSKSNGTKIIFLPQALGPFETKNGKRSTEILNKYADIIFARDKVSYNYIIKAGVNRDKVKLFPDFTIPVEGTVPEKLNHLKGKVCIIPNKKMITHANGGNSRSYINLLEDIINRVEYNNKDIFLLNHEGIGDLEMCKTINNNFENKFEIVTGLNAINVKGVIGNSYVVISSRFHGVASSLSQGVPCISTSWNHKYEMLFNDFEQSNRVVSVTDKRDDLFSKIDEVLDPEINMLISEKLLSTKINLIAKVNLMWVDVWHKVSN